jgi:hypothetical protein
LGDLSSLSGTVIVFSTLLFVQTVELEHGPPITSIPGSGPLPFFYRRIVIVGEDSPEILIWNSVFNKTFHLVFGVFRGDIVLLTFVLDPANGIEGDKSEDLTCQLRR